MPDPLSPEELRLIDAWWRAANYLTVGQIYLQDNPLLREPLRPEHIKPRLLGHWGTSPGPEPRLRAPEPAHPARTTPTCIYLAGPGPRRPGGRRQRLPRGDLLRGLPEVTRDAAGPAAAVPAVLDARRGPEPRERPDAGLDPRGRRARLRARPRLRRRVRQPRPALVARDRRRRGGDRPARGLVEGHQLPQPGARRRGAADPAPQRVQDRRARPCSGASTDDEIASCSAATATRCASSRATTRPRVHRRFAATLDACYATHPRDPARRARQRGHANARAGR